MDNPDNKVIPNEQADYVYFMYRNHNDIFERRCVKIHELWYGQSVHYGEHPDSWFLRGMCNDRKSMRDFMLSRVIGMVQWNWMTDGGNPIERPLGTAAEQALLAVYVEAVKALREAPVSVDMAYDAMMNTLRGKPALERENTMLLDATGKMIHVGDKLRLGVDNPFMEVHGDWCDYTVEKAPGGYRLSYHISQKGAVLPVGYTAGFMTDFILEQVNMDMKTVVFSQVPLKSVRLTIVNEMYS